MALYQESVLKHHISSLDEAILFPYWEHFKEYFLSSITQNIIQQKKEEELQYEFLENLFAKSLGYSLLSNEKQNLFVEVKNLTDSKKADGAIKINNEIKCVIELKSTKTKNLKDIQSQAFQYKISHPNCNYVVTSNFNKLRFYIENTTEYKEFDLFNLNYEEFKVLWICLSYESISIGKPLKIKNESIIQEEKVTKRLYKDYSDFRQNLFTDLKINNPQLEPDVLLQKTQKLLDRLLFILFCEDRGLLPNNSISEINDFWQKKIEFSNDETLYDTYVTYFEVINRGRPKRGDKEAIYAYNGGLFSKDEILDYLVISDDLLLKYSKKLTSYDFESEVSVNILGHIFENSLTEIENLQAQIDGIEVDNSKTKRKKDGVFYTPQYITKYIVDNTVGKLCQEKKEELKIDEGEYYKGRKGRPEKKLKSLLYLLEQYREWLLSLKICDPACGSGAFLNQALEFLISEHKYLDELQSSLLGGGFQFPEVENSILENNLFGVDINEESVEIAKLSLWLRTAQKGRKLTSLNDNIKCGNSLIDDPEVAGEKAFNWQNEFPDVFEKGGFDVVIGNPPYGAILNDIEKEFYRKRYSELQFKIDTYSIFILKVFQLAKTNGLSYYIVPNTLLDNFFEEKVRKQIITKGQLIEIIDLDDKIFDSAVVHSMIIGIRNSYKDDYTIKVSSTKELGSRFEEIPINYFKIQEKSIFAIRNYKNRELLEKLSSKSIKLKQILDIRQTIKTGNDKIHITDFKREANYKPILSGRDIDKWIIKDPELFVNYGKHLACPRDPIIFEQPKILIREAGNRITASYDDSGYYIMSSLYACILIDKNFDLKYILSLLNSSLFQFQLKLIAFDKTKGAFTKARIFHYYELPVKVIDSEKQSLFNEKANSMINISEKFFKEVTAFLIYLKTYSLNKNSSIKLRKWYELEFSDFVKELDKQIDKQKNSVLNDSAKFSLMKLFEEQKKKVELLKYEIDKTDEEIDRMVYELYGLTKEEIEIVENS